MKQIAKPLNTISLHTCVWVVIGSTSGMAPTLFLLFVQPNMSCLPSQSTILRYCTLAIGCPIPTHHWIFSGWILQGRWSHQTLGFYMLYSFQSIFSEVVKSSRILKSKGKPFYVAAQVHWWICHASKLRWFVGTECIQSWHWLVDCWVCHEEALAIWCVGRTGHGWRGPPSPCIRLFQGLLQDPQNTVACPECQWCP